MLPEQARLPLELSMVQPVEETPPAISTLPLEELAIWTKPVPLALRVKLLLLPVAIAPALTKVKPVALTPIVSKVETEERAPLLITIPLIVLLEVGAEIA